MSIDVRTMLRTALDESRAKTVRLEKALEALGEEPGESRADGRRDSWHRGRTFLQWMAEQDIGTVVTHKQMYEQFGYTGSNSPLSYNRWFNFTRIGTGEYRYAGCRGHLPKRNPELSLIQAAMRRQGVKPLDAGAAWVERKAAVAAAANSS